jgi:hypothetical protein
MAHLVGSFSSYLKEKKEIIHIKSVIYMPSREKCINHEVKNFLGISQKSNGILLTTNAVEPEYGE